MEAGECAVRRPGNVGEFVVALGGEGSGEMVLICAQYVDAELPGGRDFVEKARSTIKGEQDHRRLQGQGHEGADGRSYWLSLPHGGDNDYRAADLAHKFAELLAGYTRFSAVFKLGGFGRQRLHISSA
jgi:hypothetical protein